MVPAVCHPCPRTELLPIYLDCTGLLSNSGGPTQKRVLSQLLANPAHLNRYSYVWASPLGYEDSSGANPEAVFFSNVNLAIDVVNTEIQMLMSQMRFLDFAVPLGASLGGLIVAHACELGPELCTVGASDASLLNSQVIVEASFVLGGAIREKLIWQEVKVVLEAAEELGRAGNWEGAIGALEFAREKLGGLQYSRDVAEQVADHIDRALGAATELEKGNTVKESPGPQLPGAGGGSGPPGTSWSPQPSVFQRPGEGAQCYACGSLQSSYSGG